MRAQTRDLAAREAELEALQQQLTQSVSSPVTGDDWKRPGVRREVPPEEG